MRKRLSHSEAGKLGAEASRQTIQQQKVERRRLYEDNPKVCSNPDCSNTLPFDKRRSKYCGHSCAATVTGKGKVRNPEGGRTARSYNANPAPEDPGHHACPGCGVAVKDWVGEYCKQSCKSKHKWDLFVAEVEATGEIVGEESKIRYKIRKYLLATRPHECEICGVSEWLEQPVPLVADHIDGNSDNGKVTNLRLICRNCDGLLPTFAARNRGNGRAWRRARYAAGLSS